MNQYILAIINLLTTGVQLGLIPVGNAHSAVDALQSDQEHHKAIDDAYAARIAQAQAEATGSGSAG